MDLREHVRTDGTSVGTRHCRNAQELGDAAAHRGVGAEIVGVVVVEDLHEVIEAGAVLPDGERNGYGAAERGRAAWRVGRETDPRST